MTSLISNGASASRIRRRKRPFIVPFRRVNVRERRKGPGPDRNVGTRNYGATQENDAGIQTS
jgi:hypothetical protein